jgi:hypothetical protein
MRPEITRNVCCKHPLQYVEPQYIYDTAARTSRRNAQEDDANAKGLWDLLPLLALSCLLLLQCQTLVPDGVAINEDRKTVHILEFKRSTDRDEGFLELKDV